ncbi:phage tail assembly protein [Xanthobacter dioxanivorans]|uniref:Phage tail assembly protein n=1 Tax=Xanthobacter dioxanivorans TaxID=2528964 RepID=A0A974PLR7_9HYPH|nr:phage tail assembly protein [Xanthobacter dioxanivorans]QRG05925.1 phage tail assembly protein [Xanthobacter dioxanivorans]
MASTTITLDEPVLGHGGEIRTLTVREPKGHEFFEFGEPFSHARNPDGTIYSIEIDGVLKKYVAACVENAGEPELMRLCLADAMAVKDAVLGFFTGARLKNSAKSATS